MRTYCAKERGGGARRGSFSESFMRTAPQQHRPDGGRSRSARASDIYRRMAVQNRISSDSLRERSAGSLAPLAWSKRLIESNTMEFRIADTFTDSLARLSSEEQKAAKTTAFDLQMNPSQPG